LEAVEILGSMDPSSAANIMCNLDARTASEFLDRFEGEDASIKAGRILAEMSPLEAADLFYF